MNEQRFKIENIESNEHIEVWKDHVNQILMLQHKTNLSNCVLGKKIVDELKALSQYCVDHEDTSTAFVYAGVLAGIRIFEDDGLTDDDIVFVKDMNLYVDA